MEGAYSNFEKAVNKLEKKLRTQRNKPMRSATLGLMGVERSRQTGLPVIYKEGKEHYDAGTFAKFYVWEKLGDTRIAKRNTTKNLCNKAFLPYETKESISESKIAYDIEKITGQNDWIAIIHADGNGLGQIVQKVGTDAQEFKKFSNLLDKATTEAAYLACKWLIDNKKFVLDNENKQIPIRPIVLGGDDFTAICRADIALDYVTEFINQFEVKTKEYLSAIIKKHNVFTNGDVRDSLTACAGIAYIKSSFPFYYGYELAEALCSRAKKDAKDKNSVLEWKELPMSCLMFHKVQDSFTEDWNSIVKRELTPQPNVSFEFGPYYLHEKDSRWTIEALKENAEKLEGKEGNAVKSHLRNWMSLLHNNPEMANQKLERLKSMTTEEYRDFIKKITFKYDSNSKELQKTPVYDMLAIHTINTQKTKEEDK